MPKKGMDKLETLLGRRVDMVERGSIKPFAVDNIVTVYAVVKNVEIIVQLRFHSLMKEFDICGLEIFGQEGTLYLLFKLREKIQIFLLYAIEYNLGYAASSERRHKVGILDMLLFAIKVQGQFFVIGGIAYGDAQQVVCRSENGLARRGI